MGLAAVLERLPQQSRLANKFAPMGLRPPNLPAQVPHPRDASIRPNPRRRVSLCPSVLGWRPLAALRRGFNRQLA
jgi:hypothetical protein